MDPPSRNKLNRLLLYLGLGLVVMIVFGLSLQQVAVAVAKPTPMIANPYSGEVQALEQALQANNLSEEGINGLTEKLEIL
jgi:hypothetical protein